MIFSALSSPATRLSITANCTVVVSMVSFGQADDIASFASADATTSPLSELLCASVGFNRRSINPTCHSIRPTARGAHSRQYPRGPYVSIPVMEPGIKTNVARDVAADVERFGSSANEEPTTRYGRSERTAASVEFHFCIELLSQKFADSSSQRLIKCFIFIVNSLMWINLPDWALH